MAAIKFKVYCRLSPGVLWCLDTYDTEAEADARAALAVREGDQNVCIMRQTSEVIRRLK